MRAPQGFQAKADLARVERHAFFDEPSRGLIGRKGGTERMALGKAPNIHAIPP